MSTEEIELAWKEILSGVNRLGKLSSTGGNSSGYTALSNFLKGEAVTKTNGQVVYRDRPTIITGGYRYTVDWTLPGEPLALVLYKQPLRNGRQRA